MLRSYMNVTASVHEMICKKWSRVDFLKLKNFLEKLKLKNLALS
jgi:hypothetical protein